MCAGCCENPPARQVSVTGGGLTLLCRLACLASTSDVSESETKIASAMGNAFMANSSRRSADYHDGHPLYFTKSRRGTVQLVEVAGSAQALSLAGALR